MAADKNNCLAQYYLGVIYYANLYNIERNINKSIHYFTLSSNANFKNSQYYLGLIYYLGEYVPKDINKSIYYFKLSADQNNSYSQFFLGFIYYDISYGKQDIKKAIFYLTASANNSNRLALNLLGLIYIKGKDVTKDIDKGLCYLIESAEKKFVISCFIIGFIYHQGKYIDQDIDQAIHYYKEAINLNNNWARNNLAIIYKNGFPNKISPNIYSSIEYLNEAIQYKDDILSMYNLSHIYIFDFETNEHLDKAIELLMRAISKIESFTQLFYLLSFALVKKYDFNVTKINEFLENEIQNGNIHQSKTYQIINEHMLYDKSSFDYMFDLYKGIDFLYNYKGLYVSVKNLYKYKYKNKNNENTNTQIRKNITREFYDGFGIDL